MSEQVNYINLSVSNKINNSTNVSSVSSSSSSFKEKSLDIDDEKHSKRKVVDRCPIMDCKYTNILNKEITCLYCNYKACSNCIKMYLLSKIIPQCMNCNRMWDWDFLYKNFSKSWITTEYSNHEKKNLLDKEKSMLPLAVAEIEKRKIQKRISELIVSFNINDRRGESVNYWINDIQKNIQINQRMLEEKELEYYSYINDKKTTKIYEKKKSRLWNDITKIKGIINDQKLSLEKEYICKEEYSMIRDRCKKELEELGYNTSTNIIKEVKKITYHRPCPGVDCKGFLNNHWNCGICNIKVCKDCHEIITENQYLLLKQKEKEEKSNSVTKDDEIHVCNPDTVETVKLLKKDTKNCPGCKALIYKIDGCDQMFCVECKTSFSWKTGEIEKGRLHNPHYYEWLRKTSKDGQIRREEGDTRTNNRILNPTEFCGGENPLLECRAFNDNSFTKYITELHRLFVIYDIDVCKWYNHISVLNHLREVIRPRYNRINRNVIDDKFMALRIRYVHNTIDEKNWQMFLLKIEKRNRYDLEMNMLFDAILAMMQDTLYKVYTHEVWYDLKVTSLPTEIKLQLKEYLYSIEVEFEYIINYFNDTLKTIHERYNYKQQYTIKIDKKIREKYRVERI